MAAEGLPPGGPPSTLSSWELETWYQDLEEVLAAEESGGHPPLPWGAQQAPWGSGGYEVEAAELLELQDVACTEPAPQDCSAPSWVPPTAEEDEEGGGTKRKRRCGGPVASREVAKRHERATNEQRVEELKAQNARLRQEIGRLSAEVQRTRAALIDRIVNLRCPTSVGQGLGCPTELGQAGTWGAYPPGTE